METLNAVTLKKSLWETLNRIKSNELDAAKGDAIASQAREILRTTNTQLKIVSMSKQELSEELIGFAMPKKLD
jgi:hypothetical protein